MVPLPLVQCREKQTVNRIETRLPEEMCPVIKRQAFGCHERLQKPSGFRRLFDQKDIPPLVVQAQRAENPCDTASNNDR